jgi:hypothetical protein
MSEGRYCVTGRIADHWADDRGYREHVEHGMKVQLGTKLVEEIPLDEPIMVRLRKEVGPDYRDRSTVIRYDFELRHCHSMDQIVYRPVFREPEPEIRYVDRPMPYPVYVEVEPPSLWDRFTNHLKSLAAEVEYDGGYGEPE